MQKPKQLKCRKL